MQQLIGSEEALGVGGATSGGGATIGRYDRGSRHTKKCENWRRATARRWDHGGIPSRGCSRKVAGHREVMGRRKVVRRGGAPQGFWAPRDPEAPLGLGAPCCGGASQGGGVTRGVGAPRMGCLRGDMVVLHGLGCLRGKVCCRGEMGR